MTSTIIRVRKALSNGPITAKEIGRICGTTDARKYISRIRGKEGRDTVKSHWVTGKNRFRQPTRFKEYWI
jgi:hypothetical protein